MPSGRGRPASAGWRRLKANTGRLGVGAARRARRRVRNRRGACRRLETAAREALRAAGNGGGRRSHRLRRRVASNPRGVFDRASLHARANGSKRFDRISPMRRRATQPQPQPRSTRWRASTNSLRRWLRWRMATAAPLRSRDDFPRAVRRRPTPCRATTATGAGPDDGALRAGSTPAYVDNGDATITDLATGLMWEKKCEGCGGLHDVAARLPLQGGEGRADAASWLRDVNAEAQPALPATATGGFRPSSSFKESSTTSASTPRSRVRSTPPVAGSAAPMRVRPTVVARR